MVKIYDFNNEILINDSFIRNKSDSCIYFIHCTKDYYEYYFTTIYSIICNTNSFIEIVSFFSDYDEEKFFFFKNKYKDFDKKVDFHIFKIEKNILSEKWIVKNYIDRYSRFLMFHKYFHSLKNAIYMDCDIVVNSDIYLKMIEIDNKLVRKNKTEFTFFCVKDICLHLESCFFDYNIAPNIHRNSSFEKINYGGNLDIYGYIKKYLRVNPHNYFNNGFFYVSNFKAFNFEKIKQTLEKDFMLLDQDIANLLFSKNIYYLDEKFNFPVLAYEFLLNLIKKDKKSWNESFVYQSLLNCPITNKFIEKYIFSLNGLSDFKSIDIIHFSGGSCGKKPWDTREMSDKEYVNIWKKYNMIFFDKSINNYKKKQSFFKRFCRFIIRKIME